MSISCQCSNVCSDVRCLVCGQGFLVYDAMEAGIQPADVRQMVQHALRQHHAAGTHPAGRFQIDSHTTLAHAA